MAYGRFEEILYAVAPPLYRRLAPSVLRGRRRRPLRSVQAERLSRSASSTSQVSDRRLGIEPVTTPMGLTASSS